MFFIKYFTFATATVMVSGCASFGNFLAPPGYLVTSLEPCPMCFARLLTSSIGSVRYVAFDEEGGMAAKPESLPKTWQRIFGIKRNRFIKPDGSRPELANIALELITSNAEDLNSRLMSLHGH